MRYVQAAAPNRKALMKSIARKIQVVFRFKPAGFAVPVKVLVPLPVPRRKATRTRR